MGIANIGDTIEYSFPNNHDDSFFAGKKYRGVVEHVFEEEEYYGVSAGYGKDYISFENATIIKN